jgi:hypothetical protein
MRKGTVLGGLLLAVGSLSVGCGGTITEAPTELASREDAIWMCDGTQGFLIDCYADAALTQWIGFYECICKTDGSGGVSSYGTCLQTSKYKVTSNVVACYPTSP